jgi:hypothetical protein
MPITPDDIQPAQPAAPAPTDNSSAPEGDAGIPEDVLRIPAIYGLLQGKPAAIYSPKNQPDPDISTVLKHGNELINAGFRFYEATSKPVNVLYNTLFLSEEDLQKADTSGELDKVAEPFAEVKASFDSLRTKKTGETGSAAPAAAPAVAAGGAPAPAGVQNKLATARIGALTPENSTTGRGRILTAIQKPVV